MSKAGPGRLAPGFAGVIRRARGPVVIRLLRTRSDQELSGAERDARDVDPLGFIVDRDDILLGKEHERRSNPLAHVLGGR